MKHTSDPPDNKTRRGNKTLKTISKFDKRIKTFPALPGVYLMKSKKDVVIYVGKAINLKKRVRSYFTGSKEKRPTVRFLLPRINDIEFVVTQSEKEALILENTLIKKYRPKYNLDLKDDKSYVSLKLNIKSAYPGIFLTRRIKRDGSLYFGPYSSATAVRETKEIMRDIFMLRTCSDSVLRNRSRACLNYQIKKCSAPCGGFISKEEYDRSVDGVKMFLKGDVKGLIRSLKARMKQAAQKEEFEQAALIRDKINAVNLTVEKQRAVTHKHTINNDIIGIFKQNEDISINVINVRAGNITSIGNHIFLSSSLSEDEAFSSFIKQFYHRDIEIPNEIILSKTIEDMLLIKEWLTEKRGSNVSIRVPKRGESKRILEMAEENAKESLLNRLRAKDDTVRHLSLIKEKLHLNNLPQIIECYDISNIMGKSAVGSKVVMRDGAPDKASYRRYKIRTKDTSDDYGMMYEVLRRRFRGDDEHPDLILIDGGKGHLSIALKVLNELKITAPDVVSLAKEKKLKTEVKDERVYLPRRKNPVVISNLGAAFNLLIRLRDEAHRFAITYHKKLRGKKLTASLFDGITGIGPKKKELIFAHINSLDDINEVTLKEIKGLTKNDIENILKSF